MRVAIVGSGVSGLAATWLLNEHGSGHQVHLFESDPRVGGHANTVRFCRKGQDPNVGVDVDTGFIVLNPYTYPNFLRFLKHPRPSTRSSSSDSKNAISSHGTIDTVPTEMTFSVSRTSEDGKKFEWAGDTISTVFTQRDRILDPGMWRLVWDVFRFNACARRVLYGCEPFDISVGQYLEREGYSSRFKHDYLLPMTAAIWSTPPGKCADDFPIRTLVQFMKNHHLLQITGKPKWLTIAGGSRKYVESIISLLPQQQLHLNSRVTAVRTSRNESSPPGTRIAPRIVELTYRTPSGQEVTENFDYVILACHSDSALTILRNGGGATPAEEEVLGRFQWNQNECWLHHDPRLMPNSRPAWSCWNYITQSASPGQPNSEIVSLTYGMNDLQHISLSKYGPVLVTLNPPSHIPIDENKVVGKWKYEHPVLDGEAIKSQAELHKIQNKRGISFAGAWTKYGFHEDGFTSGLVAAAELLPDEPDGMLESFPPSSGGDTSDYIVRLSARKSRHLPFPIVPPQEDSSSFDMTVDWPIMLLIGFFEYMESSGLRAWNGAILGFWLWWIRKIVEVVLRTKFEW